MFSLQVGEVGEASRRRLGPSLDVTSPTHPTQSLDPSLTSLPNPAPCTLPVGTPHLTLPLSLAVCPSQGPVHAFASPALAGSGWEVPGRGGAGSTRERSRASLPQADW